MGKRKALVGSGQETKLSDGHSHERYKSGMVAARRSSLLRT